LYFVFFRISIVISIWVLRHVR